MCHIMPSPEEVREAPEMALLASLAYSLEATQVALAASYPSLYEDESDLDDTRAGSGAEDPTAHPETRRRIRLREYDRNFTYRFRRWI